MYEALIIINMYMFVYIHCFLFPPSPLPPLFSTLPLSLLPSLLPSLPSSFLSILEVVSRLSCHCEGPFFCNTSSASCVADKNGDSDTEISCVIQKDFFDNGQTEIYARCLAVDLVSYMIACEPPDQVSALKTWQCKHIFPS